MKNTVLAALALACASATLSAPALAAADCTADLRELEAWTLEYRVSGGIAGLDRHLSLTQGAELSVGNHEGREGFGSRVAGHASPELMARIGEFIKVARKAPPSQNDDIADALYRSLTVTAAGAQCELEVPDDIDRVLGDVMDATLKRAFVGSWWESAWKLCQPARQLAAEDYDLSIERLEFEGDGHFSVTWQGGGARVYSGSDKPHETISDYSGRYQIAPAYSYIQMRFEGGIYTPRDFSGNGHYRINGDELVLQGIWLGTYRTKNKPDICELTFQRVVPSERTSRNP
jgi:hypothetical protein